LPVALRASLRKTLQEKNSGGGEREKMGGVRAKVNQNQGS